MNKHKDHIASCLCCTNLYSNDATPGYSETTPAYPPSITCMANEKMPDIDDLTELMQFMHDHGMVCKKFIPKS